MSVALPEQVSTTPSRTQFPRIAIATYPGCNRDLLSAIATSFPVVATPFLSLLPPFLSLRAQRGNLVPHDQRPFALAPAAVGPGFEIAASLPLLAMTFGALLAMTVEGTIASPARQSRSPPPTAVGPGFEIAASLPLLAMTVGALLAMTVGALLAMTVEGTIASPARQSRSPPPTTVRAPPEGRWSRLRDCRVATAPRNDSWGAPRNDS